MLKRVTIYISCALLILIGVHVWAQQVAVPIEILLEMGPDMALIIDDSPMDFGIIPWPLTPGNPASDIRDIEICAGVGSAFFQIAINPVLVDLNSVSPDQPISVGYFRAALVDDPTNTPPTFFLDAFTNNGIFLDPASPAQTPLFSDTQTGTFQMVYDQESFAVKGSWQTFVTLSVIAQ